MRLAIPLPSSVENCDAGEYVYSVLPINREWIQSIWATTLDVRPLTGDPATLAGRLGDIIHDEDQEANLVVEVSVAIVDLCAVSHPRGRTKTQWPAVVVVNGHRFPK